ncbi:hypothetical protein Tco_1445355 [Tanacetum coccineum]
MVDDTGKEDINSILTSFVDRMKNMESGSDGKHLKSGKNLQHELNVTELLANQAMSSGSPKVTMAAPTMSIVNMASTPSFASTVSNENTYRKANIRVLKASILDNVMGSTNMPCGIGLNNPNSFPPMWNDEYVAASGMAMINEVTSPIPVTGSYVAEKTSTTNMPSSPNEDVLTGMTIDKQNVIMDAIVAVWEKLLAEVTITSIMPSATVSNNSTGLTGPQGNVPKLTHIVDMTGPSIELPIMDSPIVQSVLIQSKSNSYAIATSASISEQSKGKANFRLLYSDNLCNGVDFTIPKKVVKAVSTRFENKLYGYFIGKRIAFLVGEYFVRNN